MNFSKTWLIRLHLNNIAFEHRFVPISSRYTPLVIVYLTNSVLLLLSPVQAGETLAGTVFLIN